MRTETREFGGDVQYVTSLARAGRGGWNIMKVAVAGDSAGEKLAHVLAEHLKSRFDVFEVSRTNNVADAFYANMADRVASGVG